MNKVILSGRLVADAELKYIAGTGTPKGTYKIAVERRFKDKDGSKKTDFIPCEQLGKQMENLVQYLTKGKLIEIDGELHIENWKDAEGNWKSFTSVKVDNLIFIPVGKGSQEQANEPTFTPNFEPQGLDPQGWDAISDSEIPF